MTRACSPCNGPATSGADYPGIGSEPTRIVTSNLRRIESIPWISEQLSLLDTFNEGEQPGAVQLAALSGIPRQQAYEILAYVLRHGKAPMRTTWR